MVESPSQSDLSPLPDTRAEGTFVGRGPEMGQLKEALEDSISGRGRLVMLAGEPGIGKTHTAQELAGYAETLGVQVLWGRCYEEEGSPPYWPWLQSLRFYIQRLDPEPLQAQMGPGAADIAEILAEVREKLPDLELPPPLEPEQARFRLFSSITTFLKNVAQSQPLMLVLDDLHWVDRSSLRLLEFLAREIQSSPLLILGTYRDVEVSRRHPLSETLGSLVREQPFLRVQLSGLEHHEVEELLQKAMAVSLPSGLAEIIHQRTEGNPLFVNELIGMLNRDDLEAGQDYITRIPEGVRDVIGRRLNRLSEDCNQFLTTASVVGREFGFKLLCALKDDFTETLMLGLVDEALEAHVIEELPEGGDSYQFSHALVQESLAAELSTSRRMRLHARIGEALEDLYGDGAEAHASELAYHFGKAMQILGVKKLVYYSLRAGEQALTTNAWEEALSHFQRALAAKEGQPTDAETASILFGLGRAQGATLKNQEARASLRRAFDHYMEAEDITRAVAVAEYPVLPVAGTTIQSHLVTRALSLVPLDSHEAGRLLATYGLVRYQETGNPDGAREAFKTALDIAQLKGDMALELRILAAAADVDWYHLQIQDVIARGKRTTEISRRVDDPSAEVRACFYTGLALDAVGEREGMRIRAHAMWQAAKRLRDRSWLANALWLNGSQCMREGNWETARDFMNRGLAVEPHNPLILSTKAVLEYEVGNFGQGQAHLEQLLEMFHQTEPGPNGPCVQSAMAIPTVARITGVTDWLDVAEAAAVAVLSSPSANPGIAIRSRVGLALLAVQRHDVSLAGEQYPALAACHGNQLSPAGIVSIHRLLGLLAHVLSKAENAAAHFEDAQAFCRKAGYRPELAWVCHDYADTLLQMSGRSNRTRALSLLEEGLAISENLGMESLNGRTAALMERTPPRHIDLVYPDGLTRRQVEVLRLVAAGKTDRVIGEELFISVKTVGNHVSSILRKINVANRTEAATYAAHHGLL